MSEASFVIAPFGVKRAVTAASWTRRGPGAIRVGDRL
jgi:hypothetical protein